MADFKHLGRIGYYKDNDTTVTYQIGNTVDDWQADSYNKKSEVLNNIAFPAVGRYGNYNVLLKGSNNLLPDEISNMINKNRLLPKLLEKQVYWLFGKGLFVFRNTLNDGKIVREWINESPIYDWLSSWQSNGLTDSVDDYAIKIIRDFYWYEDMWAKWRMRASRMINGGMPVAGLEHVDNLRARLATTDLEVRLTYDPQDKEYNNVITGRWDYGYRKDFEVYPRMRPNNVLRNAVSISYHKAGTPGQVYGMNKFYLGTRPWLIGTNNNPDSINAYLENSLSARHHVIIPYEYVQSVEKKLQDYCELNRALKEQNKTLIAPEGIEIGTEYHVGLRDQLLKADLRRLTSVLSGHKNEGKIFTSWSFKSDNGDVNWKIEPIDQKYKEFIQALIEYDKRADAVITTALGIDSSISNISKDGIISKSGADVYYNYIIYMLGLTIPEQKCTEALNWAIQINFPELYRQGYRVGFYQETPSRQEEVSPNDRLQTMVNTTSANTEAIEELRDKLNKMEQTFTTD